MPHSVASWRGVYLRGLIQDCDRKGAEPMAAPVLLPDVLGRGVVAHNLAEIAAVGSGPAAIPSGPFEADWASHKFHRENDFHVATRTRTINRPCGRRRGF